MIDIEPDVIDEVSAALSERYGEDFALNDVTLLAPPVLPCACIECIDNIVLKKTQDTGSGENHAEVVFDVNAYSNKVSGKKRECKEIIGVIDGVLIRLGFTRLTLKPITLDDATKYRLFARYTAVVSKDKTIYRR